jgi:hypothetical protein
MSAHLLYSEKLSSKRTELLFIALTLLFLSLSIWRWMDGKFDFLAGLFLIFFVIFLFYALNYRTLVIRLTSEFLKLSFGIFTWTIPRYNIGEVQLDEDLPVWMKYGGAGIHFMMVRKRYRASFNFLEYSRVVIGLKRKAGMVRDISFSTCQPDEIMRLLKGAILENKTA